MTDLLLLRHLLAAFNAHLLEYEIVAYTFDVSWEFEVLEEEVLSEIIFLAEYALLAVGTFPAGLVDGQEESGIAHCCGIE